MAKYRKKPEVIEAEQWNKVTYDREAGHGFKPDDMPIYHLGVGYYRTPDLEGQEKCKKCGDIMHNHGWMESIQEAICPGDWIIPEPNGAKHNCKPGQFEASYEEVK